jgi:CheY-like chemotaxis protein
MRLKPDVIVSDISMPVLNGIEAADQLKNQAASRGSSS